MKSPAQRPFQSRHSTFERPIGRPHLWVIGENWTMASKRVASRGVCCQDLFSGRYFEGRALVHRRDSCGTTFGALAGGTIPWKPLSRPGGLPAMPMLFDQLNFARHQDAHEDRPNQRWFAGHCGRDGSLTRWSSTFRSFAPDPVYARARAQVRARR
jgi:hypothetical protein